LTFPAITVTVVLMSQRVEVYWNLHKNCFSYRPIGGRVIHADSIVLKDVTFAVQPAGRERVLREKKKNVHAFVRGTLIAATDKSGYVQMHPGFQNRDCIRLIDDCLDDGVCVRYNPYESDSFQTLGGLRVSRGDYAYLSDKRIFVSGGK
jgi:hypothetical protein